MEKPLVSEEEASDPSATPGQRVRFLRERARYSVRELAKLAGIPRSTLSSLETGVVTKGLALPEIARALQVPYEYLLHGGGLRVTVRATPTPRHREPDADPPAAGAATLTNVSQARMDALSPQERSYVEKWLNDFLERSEALRDAGLTGAQVVAAVQALDRTSRK